jgi:hypothetical protein
MSIPAEVSSAATRLDSDPKLGFQKRLNHSFDREVGMATRIHGPCPGEDRRRNARFSVRELPLREKSKRDLTGY